MDLVKKVIRPGVKIALRPDRVSGQEAETQEIKYYHSQISDVREDGGVEVYMPLEREKMILLTVDVGYDMHCYTVSGMYECRVVVTERYKKDGLFYALLQLTSELKRNQRREYYRYQCTLPMKDRRLDEEEEKFLAEHKKLVIMDDGLMDKSTIINISGGGIQFVSSHQYAKDELIYCKFDFGKKREICVKILECAAVPDRPGEYRHRSKFIGLEKKEREGIIRQIFALERMKIKTSRKNGGDAKA